MDRFIRILENEDWIVDYDKLNNKYRVAMFVNLNFVDEVWFDAYEEKEDCIIFPHTIGNITFYSKTDLVEWVEKQQKLNNILEQEGYLKTQHTCSEKWVVPNYKFKIE